MTLMKKKSRNHAKQVGVWSALAGGAIGFALGMLFAPKRGPDARRQLTYQLEHLAAEAEGFLRQFLRSSIESEARRSSDALVKDVEARADHIRDDIDALMEELREASRTSDDAE